MVKFVSVTPEQDEVIFAAWGKVNKKHDKDTQYLIEEGTPIEGVVLEYKDTDKGYKKIIKLNVKGIDKPLLILGKTDLINKFEAGNVEKGDLVRITFTGVNKTKNNHDFYTFDVAVAKA